MSDHLNRRPKARLNVHIIGCGHSGSTLLDMLLGGHTSIAALGEVYFLHFYARHRLEADRCTCGAHVLECPFWKSVDHRMRADLHLDPSVSAFIQLELADEGLGKLRDARGEFIKRKPGAPVPTRSRLNEASLVLPVGRLRPVLGRAVPSIAHSHRIATNLNHLYDAVAAAHDRPIVLESTKNPGSFKSVYLAAWQPMKFVLVTRDGRGVCNSRIHRENVTMRQAIGVWTAENVKRWAAQASIPRRNILRVRYEALCQDPRAELRRVCEFLGVDFEEGMLDFRADRHNLGGNPMRRRKAETEIRLDERWRRELTADQLSEFSRRGGWLNRVLGYSA